MPKRLFFPVLFCFCLNSQAQDADSLFAPYLRNKYFLAGYLPEFCMAVSYYPELKDTKIIVKEKNIRTVMAARPSFGSYFKRKSRRTYIIFVDTLFSGRRGLFYELYTTARIGLIGHELSHISIYNKKNILGLAGYGIVYLLNRKKQEHRADENAIDHGLFSQLYDYSLIAFDPEKVGEKYYRYKKKYYYSPSELIELNNRKKQ